MPGASALSLSSPSLIDPKSMSVDASAALAAPTRDDSWGGAVVPKGDVPLSAANGSGAAPPGVLPVAGGTASRCAAAFSEIACALVSSSKFGSRSGGSGAAATCTTVADVANSAAATAATAAGDVVNRRWWW